MDQFEWNDSKVLLFLGQCNNSWSEWWEEWWMQISKNIPNMLKVTDDPRLQLTDHCLVCETGRNGEWKSANTPLSLVYWWSYKTTHRSISQCLVWGWARNIILQEILTPPPLNSCPVSHTVAKAFKRNSTKWHMKID